MKKDNSCGISSANLMMIYCPGLLPGIRNGGGGGEKGEKGKVLKRER